MYFSDLEEIKEDDLTGQVRGHLSVLGWSRRYSLKNIKLYVVKCSVCSQDPELYGDGLFEINKANFLAGRIPCGCSKGYKYSEKQAVIRILRVMKDKPFTFKGFVGGYKDSSSRVIFECEKHGQWDTRTTASVCSNGTGCRFCGTLVTADKLRAEKETLLSDVKSKVEAKGYIYHGISGEYKGLRTRLLLECPEHGEWDSTNINKMRYSSERGCPKCGDERRRLSRLMPEQERLVQVQQISSALGYKFNGWFGEFKGILTKLKLECPEHGEWKTTDIRGFTENGVGCPPCRSKAADMAYVHLLKDGESLVGLKFGISVRPAERLSEQQRKSCFNLESLGVWKFPNRNECWLAERECLTTLECGVIDRQYLPDGFKETTQVHNFEKILKIYESFGGIRLE